MLRLKNKKMQGAIVIVDTDQIYKELKPLLFSLAYRLIGNVWDAEDIVQEAFVTYEEIATEKIEDTKPYLCKVVTNRCMDYLRSVKKQRELYIGTWLPEPLVIKDNGHEEPLEQVVVKESISTAYLLLLHQLTELERAVFLLRTIFQYSYREIAEIVGESDNYCRQLFYRARKAIDNNTYDTNLDRKQANKMAEQFTNALINKNIDSLRRIIVNQTRLSSDGGGKSEVASLHPISGSVPITHYLKGLLSVVPTDIYYKMHTINGWPGIIISSGEKVIGAISFQFSNNYLSDIYIVSNPDKLLHLNTKVS
jgi:RNA polymerase sigma factor (sigma-70 family)